MNSKVLIVVFLSCFVGALSLDLCSKSCPSNEVFSECKGGGTCQKTCSTRNTTVEECACVPGCICKPEFIRDANTYKCIKISSCPPIESTTCAKNEVYSECGATWCQKNCNTINDHWFKCACVAGCICRDGYIRSPITNQCILITSCDKCPSGYYLDSKSKRCELICDICRDSKAEFKACGDRCRELTCENPLLEGIKCPDDAQCEPGCFCKAGYIKDPKTELCIRPKSCPNPCKDPNAVYSNCGSTSVCDIKTCRFPYGQGDDCMSTCEKGCFCKPGYVKNDSGKCVRPKNCPVPNCKRNEIYECRNPTCEPGCLLKPCMSVNCENKCYCRKGYVKENGTCVAIETCQKCDDPNAAYNNCKEECSDATCMNPNGTPELCKGNCRAGCFCNKGFVFDHTGKCVRLDKCPKCPANEIMDCRNPTCLNEGCFLSKRACLDVRCETRCYCADGFARIDGVCVPIEKCNEICSDPNTTFNSCGTSCEATCDNQNPMICPKICVAGCFCNKGFIKDSSGICIKIEKCPISTCKDPNSEHNTCGSSCSEATCKKPEGQSYECPEMCETGCFCKKGFVKNEEGKCVLPETCPIPKCPMNEEYKCGDENCERSCRLGRACLYAPCTNKCYCKAGFVRENGVCIPEEQCLRCDDRNSYANECGSACEASCKNPNPKGPCPDVCVRGCFCRPGFLKNDQGVCVPVEECPKPKECPANEVFSCGSAACEKSCGHINDTCDIVNIKCDDKCFCIEGYVRESGPNSTCIPVNTCPIVCSEPNTEFNQCASSCQPTCLKPFIGRCNKMCNAVCVCQRGFIQNESGKCIKPEECAKPNCPANEILSCRNPTCDYEGCDVIGIARACQFVPCVTKCYCAPGFVRINGVCTPKEKCPIVDPPMGCKDPNASYNTCGSACESICGKKNPLFCTANCVVGCFCNKGYIKDSKGVCIPIEKCNQPKDCPANEVFDCRHPICGERGCFVLCRPDKDTPCENRCFCADGYYRENGICIPEDKCPKEPITCDVNEVFECRNPTCDDEGCFMMGRPCQDVPCQYKCYCAPGLVRIDGKCVSRKKCFKPIEECLMPNTEYRTCVNPCTQPSCANPTTALIRCAYACVDGCFCREGYYMSDDGACIQLDQCPRPCPETCPANESCSCRMADCERSCESRRYPCDPANPFCVNKCYCNDGFIRSGKAGGACVPYEECGPIWGDLEIAEM